MTRKLTAWHCGVAELRQEFSVVTASHISVTQRPWASRSRRILSVPRRILGQYMGICDNVTVVSVALSTRRPLN